MGLLISSHEKSTIKSSDSHRLTIIFFQFSYNNTPFPHFTKITGYLNMIIKIHPELAERSAIIIQNSSNPSSRKNLDVRPYDRSRCYF